MSAHYPSVQDAREWMDWMESIEVVIPKRLVERVAIFDDARLESYDMAMGSEAMGLIDEALYHGEQYDEYTCYASAMEGEYDL